MSSEIGKIKSIIANDTKFENNCYALILENKLNEAYLMMCEYEQKQKYTRGLNCDWSNPPKKIFKINIKNDLPFKLPNCIKPYEKEVKATAIYTNIMGANPKKAVTFFCQRINTDIDRKILEKAFIFLCAYESGALNLNYSDIENLEKEQKRIDNTPAEVFEKLSIDDFINTVNRNIIDSGLSIEKFKYDVLKDGIYNFTYNDCQIGRIKIGKRCSKMQVLTNDSVKWFENLTMDEYTKNIDKWVKYAKQK